MKRSGISISILFCAAWCGGAVAHAETDLERELKKLREDRDKALAAAAEPINRRYKEQIESLQRRASQRGEMELAVQARDELKALGAGTDMAVSGIVGRWMVQGGNRPAQERELRPDGTIIRGDGLQGKWSIEGTTLILKYSDGNTTVLNLPVKNGKLSGKGVPSGEVVTAEKK